MERPYNKVERREIVIAKQKEGIFLAGNYNAWQARAEKRVESAEKGINAAEEKVNEYLEDIKAKVEDNVRKSDENANSLKEAVRLAQESHLQINAHMVQIANDVGAKLELQFNRELESLNKGMGIIDNNVTIVYNELKSWRSSASKIELSNDKRLSAIESYLAENGTLIGTKFEPIKAQVEKKADAKSTNKSKTLTAFNESDKGSINNNHK